MIRFDIPYVDTDRTLTQAGYEVLKGQERRIDALDLGKAPLPKDAAGLGNWGPKAIANGLATVCCKEKPKATINNPESINSNEPVLAAG